MSSEEEMGPIDIVVIGYPPGTPQTGEAMPLFLDLVDRGIIRVLDVLVVRKDEDGVIAGFNVADLDAERRGRPDRLRGRAAAACSATRTRSRPAKGSSPVRPPS